MINFLKILSKILLSPFALIYGSVVGGRQFLYQTKLLRSSQFDIPTICVGNLTVGGAGKTPHVEYLIRLLLPYIQVSVLSRGYKRRTEGFRIVNSENTAIDVGDEPLLYKLKYPSVQVAVSEKRAFAIPQMLYQQPNTQVILLDDAYQHLAVKPYLNILLTEYDLPFTRDFLVPMGRLRDWRNSYSRAQIIIVTKCPNDVQKIDRQHFIEEIKPYAYQKVYFSYYNYGVPYQIFTPSVTTSLDADTEVLLVCGIAKPEYLVEYLSSKVKSVTTMAFEDHRIFSNYDVAQFKRLYDGLTSCKKVVITTEKDAVRLALHKDYLVENQLDIYALPIEVTFHFDEEKTFDADVKKLLLDFSI